MTVSRLVFDDKERVGSWVAAETVYAMGAETNGKIVSGIVFNNLNESNATVHIAVSRPNKLFLELLSHAFSYAFEKCGLRRVTGFVSEDNVKALKLDKHIGFVEEGVMKQAGSKGQDVIVLVLWPQNYRKRKKK